ncbi:MAG: hypothetical protein O6837_12635, partial [Deltaproteobacteria bacterium]|nr:hypothetical protein [Deltaproteobacteria bacterium]
GLLRALADTIHFFKTRRHDKLDIINRTFRDLLRLQSDEELATFYENQRTCHPDGRGRGY